MGNDPYALFLTKFPDFTEIQKKSFSFIGEGKNCLIIAPTGSGKTEAALLPVLKKISILEDRKGISCIYITPLRALNRDLLSRLEWICRESGIRIGVRHGDTPTKERAKQSENPPDILITTPESLQNILLAGKLRQYLTSLKSVIVDEVHELYYNKRGAQLSIALERLEEISGSYQRIGVSATVGNPDETTRFLFNDRKHVIITSDQEKKFEFKIEFPVRSKIKNEEFTKLFDIDDAAFARITRIAELIRESKSTLLFANTRQIVESLGSKLIYYDNLNPFGGIGIHHSSIDKEERIIVENAFKEGRIKSMMATSSLELGIDVGNVNLVIQFGSPRQTIRFLQRAGRGGHKEFETVRGTIIVSNMIDCLESVAILKAVNEKRLEKNFAEVGALDVLINQICGLVLEYKKMDLEKVFGLFKRSAIYKDLEFGKFKEAAALSDELGLIKSNGNLIWLGRRSRDYFFSNISLIPDTNKFIVKNIVTNKIISLLDGGFVSNYIGDGASFITKGLPWKVLSIEKDTIFVEPSDDFESAVPDWEGEDIPVSKEIARSAIRSIMEDIAKMSFLDKNALNKFSDFTKKQKEYFSLSEDEVCLEEFNDYAILYLPLGKKANELLSKVIANLVLVETGSRIGIKAMPYAIIINYKEALRKPDFIKIFDSLKNITSYDNFIQNSELFRYKFTQICRAIGVLEKKAIVTRGTIDRIINFYKESIIFDEVLRDLNKNYFDVKTINEFIKDFKSGRVKLRICTKSGSPISKELLKAAYGGRELVSTFFDRDEAIEKLIGRVEKKEVLMLCTYCGFNFTETISLDSKNILCKNCKSPLVVRNSREYQEIVKKRIRNKELSKKELKVYVDMMRESSLVNSYGHRAIIALATYGIGIDTAIRILKYVRKDHKMFFVDVINAQRNFVKNRKFWKEK